MALKLKHTAAAIVAAWYVLVASSCRTGHNDDSVYHFIDPAGWAYGDTLQFPLTMADSVATGDILLSLRHTNDYIYSNIYLEVNVADSLTSRKDTLNIILADAYGRWYGRGIGTDFQITDTIVGGYTLHRPAVVTVRHIMRNDCLPEIEQVGVTFIETK